MKDFYVFIGKFADPQTCKLHVGGVQTYARDLGLLALKLGYSVSVFQLDELCNDTITLENMTIHSCHVQRSAYQSFFDKVYSKHNKSGSVFVIMTDQMDIKSKRPNVISIQHGIAFDIPGDMINGICGKSNILQHINKTLRCLRNVNRFYMCRNTVCVDYNFFNWFRTIGTIYPNKNVNVIPNYASDFISFDELHNKLTVKRNTFKIVFARRFVDYRGTKIFANVVERLIKDKAPIEITFAGSGPLENDIINRFKYCPQVRITQFSAPESIEFHKYYDIAVVPTIYSEGTSLSLIESMAAGCLPIATHVGGMTNIILDHHNGLLCYPDEDSLYTSIKEVLNMQTNEFNNIVTNAYNSAVSSFSIKIWRERWTNVINEVSNK